MHTPGVSELRFVIAKWKCAVSKYCLSGRCEHHALLEDCRKTEDEGIPRFCRLLRGPHSVTNIVLDGERMQHIQVWYSLAFVINVSCLIDARLGRLSEFADNNEEAFRGPTGNKVQNCSSAVLEVVDHNGTPQSRFACVVMTYRLSAIFRC